MLIEPGFLLKDPEYSVVAGKTLCKIFFQFSSYVNGAFEKQYINGNIWGDRADQLKKSISSFKKGSYCLVTFSNIYQNKKSSSGYLEGTVTDVTFLINNKTSNNQKYEDDDEIPF